MKDDEDSWRSVSREARKGDPDEGKAAVVILEETFPVAEGGEARVVVGSSSVEICWFRRGEKKRSEIIPMDRLLGCTCGGGEGTRDRGAPFPLSFRHFPGGRGGGRSFLPPSGSPVVTLTVHVVTAPCDPSLVLRAQKVKHVAMATRSRFPCSSLGKMDLGEGSVLLDMDPYSLYPSKKLFVFVNPRSGCGRAARMFSSKVQPILAAAEMEFEYHVTKSHGEARKMISEMNLQLCRGIVVVSGDGLLFEVYNGLYQRADWRKSLQTPVGIIPCGSGNGLARSLAHLCGEPFEHPIVEAGLRLTRGRTTAAHLVGVETSREKVCSLLSVTWGLIADVDIESERLRAAGEMRFHIWFVVRVLGLRVYQGTLSYLPAPDPVTYGRSSSCIPAMPPRLQDPLPDSWVHLLGSFVLVLAMKQSHLGSDLCLAPLARPDDGLLWLLVIEEGISRGELLKFMSAAYRGRLLSNPFVRMIPAAAFRLVPAEGQKRKGRIVVDGEDMPCDAVQAGEAVKRCHRPHPAKSVSASLDEMESLETTLLILWEDSACSFP